MEGIRPVEELWLEEMVSGKRECSKAKRKRKTNRNRIVIYNQEI